MKNIFAEQSRKGFFVYKESSFFLDRALFRFRTKADIFKNKCFHGIVTVLYEKLKIKPNVLTALGFVFGILTPLSLWYSALPWVASIFLILSVISDILDGTIARKYGLTSRWSSALDMATDIVTGTLVLLGISFLIGELTLGLVAVAVSMTQHWLHVILAWLSPKTSHTPLQGHVYTNIAFIFTWYSFGIWLYIILGGMSVILAIYHFFRARKIVGVAT